MTTPADGQEAQIATDMPSVCSCGESAILLTWPQLTGNRLRTAIQNAFERLQTSNPEQRSGATVHPVPGFASLTVHFDPGEQSAQSILERLRQSSAVTGTEIPAPALRVIPACYEMQFAPDLNELAQGVGLSPEAVIELHLSADYVVQMIGFAPGFPYLAGLPQQLCFPRKATPRLQVAAGSIAIGGTQAGIYPSSGPGGWNLIGCTPLRLFNPAESEPCLCRPGDLIRFRRIPLSEFSSWRP